MRGRILWGLAGALILSGVVAVVWQTSGSAQSSETIKGLITDAPNVPPPIKRRYPRRSSWSSR